jgi:predicted Zn-dependent protease
LLAAARSWASLVLKLRMALKSYLQSAPAEAQWAGIRLIEEKHVVRAFQDGQPRVNATTWEKGLMVEVLWKGHFGNAGTCDLSKAGVQAAWDKALLLAKSGAEKSVAEFSARQRPNSVGRFSSPVQKSFDALSAKAANDLLAAASASLKFSDKVVSSSASLWLIERNEWLASTSGADVHQCTHLVSSGYQATAAEGSETQTRSDSLGLTAQAGVELLNENVVLAACQKIGREAVELLKAENCPADTRDLVVMPDQMMLQIHESIGHPLELDRILGDERNYAGWSFVKPADFGSLQYGSKLMNVTYAPDEKGEFASFAFDEVGNPAKREFLIREGKLLRGLGSLESQHRSKIPGVANSRATSWNRAPIDRMANINLEPGNSTLDEIVSSVEKGILMETNRSWSIDDYRNKFQFGCEYGRLIENGRITRTVKNPNYRGVTVPFWNALAMLGNGDSAKAFGTPYCGKGEPNQIIRVGHSSPVCLFRQIEVFGG